MKEENESKEVELDAWKGDFGDDYTKRRHCDKDLVNRIGETLFRLLTNIGVGPSSSLLEVGSNMGYNLIGLALSGWKGKLYAVEPNQKAYRELLEHSKGLIEKVYSADGSLLPFNDRSIDLVFTSGVLIHVHPERLKKVCSEIFRVSSQYILCMEYFSSTPDDQVYREKSGLLFKRDFGRYYLELFPSLELVDYGFLWSKVVPFDDLNWWLFKKG